MVWKNDNTEPFGNSQPDENPSGLGQFVYNLRFPGQYYDQETGTSYNYYRDYDPSTGRYIESDPIGLAGGINTYGYVGGNSLKYIDPKGELSYLAVGAYLAWEGFSFYQTYEDGREEGKQDCENLIKLKRRIKEMNDETKRDEMQMQYDLNFLNAFKGRLITPIANAPGTAAEVVNDTRESIKRFKLPFRAFFTSFFLDTWAKKLGREKGLEECGCKEK